MVKNNTNVFMKYLLKVINWTSVNQPLQLYDKWVYTNVKCNTIS